MSVADVSGLAASCTDQQGIVNGRSALCLESTDAIVFYMVWTWALAMAASNYGVNQSYVLLKDVGYDKTTALDQTGTPARCLTLKDHFIAWRWTLHWCAQIAFRSVPTTTQAVRAGCRRHSVELTRVSTGENRINTSYRLAVIGLIKIILKDIINQSSSPRARAVEPRLDTSDAVMSWSINGNGMQVSNRFAEFRRHVAVRSQLNCFPWTRIRCRRRFDKRG